MIVLEIMFAIYQKVKLISVRYFYVIQISMDKLKKTKNGLQLTDSMELQVFTGDLANTQVSRYN